MTARALSSRCLGLSASAPGPQSPSVECRALTRRPRRASPALLLLDLTFLLSQTHREVGKARRDGGSSVIRRRATESSEKGPQLCPARRINEDSICPGWGVGGGSREVMRDPFPGHPGQVHGGPRGLHSVLCVILQQP